MDGGSDIVELDVEVFVRPMQGVWESCNQPKIKKERKGEAVVLKSSQSVVFCKELPTTSKATSGSYKNFDYNISSTTASSHGSYSAKKSRPWKKFTSTKKKEKSEERKEKGRPVEIVTPERGLAGSRMESKTKINLATSKTRVDSTKSNTKIDSTKSKTNVDLKKSLTQTDSRKSTEKSVISKRSEPLSKRIEEQPKEEPKPVKNGGCSYEPEYWVALALCWFLLLIWRYFLVLQMETL